MSVAENFSDNFLPSAQLAHALKNPLTALTLQLDELANSVLDANSQEITKSALEEVLHLNLLVESILNTWRINASHPLSELNLNHLVKQSVEKWRTRFQNQKRNLVLIFDREIFALGSLEIESEVFEILIENSLVHGLGETRIELLIEDDWAIFQIQDQGPGVSDSIQKNLMNYGVATNGNGIGLAWARDQVEADGGHLEIYSMKPAVFRLYLKLDPLQNF